MRKIIILLCSVVVIVLFIIIAVFLNNKGTNSDIENTEYSVSTTVSTESTTEVTEPITAESTTVTPTTENPTESPTTEPITEPITEPTTAALTTTAKGYPPKAYGEPNAFELEIFEWTNKYRSDYDKKPLKFGNFYYQCAKTRVLEAENKFSHTRPNLADFYSIFADYNFGYNGYKEWKYVGENIAQYYDNAKSVVEELMDSPGHRANILNEDFEYVAIAVKESEKYPGNYTVEQLFFK